MLVSKGGWWPHVHVSWVHMWSSEDSLWESSLFSQQVRLGDQLLYLWALPLAHASILLGGEQFQVFRSLFL